LKRIGEGTEGIYTVDGQSMVLIPPEFCLHANATLQDLINDVYGDMSSLAQHLNDPEFIIGKAILTPLNVDVDAINNLICSNLVLHKPPRTYSSFDSVVNEEQASIYPTEFLNSLTLSGLPPHQLLLQEQCPIMLLRNMPGRLANGTRCIVTKLCDHVIEVKVATGPAKDTRVLIPRMTITPSDVDSMPFTLKRQQFPVRLAFAMTINKAQGQTLNKMGLYLPKPVIAHGQLYVAMSRVGEPTGLRILVKNGWHPASDTHPEGTYATNVVYKNIF
jgi:ATP-dependent DNA helicase PIF1